MDAANSPQVSMSDLDVYTLAHIFSFLPIADRMRFQIVSKYWQDASRISLGQLTKLECFDHLYSLDCCLIYNYDKDTEDNKCSMYMRKLRQVLAICGHSIKHFRCVPGIKIKCNEKFFQLLLETCPNLEILDIQRMECTADGLDFAAKYYKSLQSNLKEFRLDFHCESLNKALIDFFASTNRLQALTVDWIYDDINITRPYFLEKLPVDTLKSLRISYYINEDFTNLLTKAIKSCSKLSALAITVYNGYYSDANEFDSSLVLSVINTNKRQDNFKSLSLKEPDCDDIMSISSISKFQNLQSLELYVGSMTNDAIKAIGNGCQFLSSLRLSVGYGEMTDEGLVNFFNLKNFDLNTGCAIKGTFLNSMPKLETVDLCCPGFEMKNLKILFDSAKSLKLLRILGVKADENLIPKEHANKIMQIYYNNERIL